MSLPNERYGLKGVSLIDTVILTSKEKVYLNRNVPHSQAVYFCLLLTKWTSPQAIKACENVQRKCVLEFTLKGSFFGSLSICSKGHFFILERTLKCSFFGSLSVCSKQCCNEDWKWTEDEDKDSLDLESRLKMKILRNFEKSSKTFEDRNFFEDIRRICNLRRIF